MRAFAEAFPDLGQKECRVIVLPEAAEDIPADRYALIEMYCDEQNCDCGRVSLNVASETTHESLCVISFGFDRDDEFRGPFLDPLYERVEFSSSLLDMVNQLVLSDSKYVARLERLYRLFKEKVCGTRLRQILAPALLSAEQVADRIAERKKRHKSLRRAQQRRRAR